MPESVECCCGRQIMQDTLTDEWDHVDGSGPQCWPDASPSSPDFKYMAEPSWPAFKHMAEPVDPDLW